MLVAVSGYKHHLANFVSIEILHYPKQHPRHSRRCTLGACGMLLPYVGIPISQVTCAVIVNHSNVKSNKITVSLQLIMS